MKILFYCPYFYPKTGGLENVASYLAKGLSKLGFEIKLITHTKLPSNTSELDGNFKIIRSTKKSILFENYIWCDIFFHHNVSLNGAWPFLIWPFKKWVVLHHLTYYNHQKITISEQLKRQLSRLAINLSCSKYVNDTLPKKGKVMYNAYDDTTFFNHGSKRVLNSIVFVGRLVSDKGCDILIQSLKVLNLKSPNKPYHLTIIGTGPEEANLNQLITNYKLNQVVTFKGILKGKDLNEELNKHQIIAIPSKWKEPFGIVALEGIAAGCIPIFSNQGGLLEACDGIGVSFESKDFNSLANVMLNVLDKYDLYYNQLIEKSEAHLKKFKKPYVLSQFYNFLLNEV